MYTHLFTRADMTCNQKRLRDEQGGGGMDGPIGAGGPGVPASDDPAPAAERPRLKLAPRSKPAGQAASAAAPAPSTAKKNSIFGGGRAHDEFAYEVSCDDG